MFEFKRICKKCGKTLVHKGNNEAMVKYQCKIADEKGSCKFCSRKLYQGKKRGDNRNGWLGKHIPDEHKKKLSKANMGISTIDRFTDETKRKLSEKTKSAWDDPVKRQKMIHKCRWNNKVVDKGQLEFLDKWNKLGFKFEPNYRIKDGTDLFYIDGYDKEHNVVVEYDSKYHNNATQKQKDLVRQNKVVEILQPKKFWRYNKMKKVITNIMEGRVTH